MMCQRQACGEPANDGSSKGEWRKERTLGRASKNLNQRAHGHIRRVSSGWEAGGSGPLASASLHSRFLTRLPPTGIAQGNLLASRLFMTPPNDAIQGKAVLRAGPWAVVCSATGWPCRCPRCGVSSLWTKPTFERRERCRSVKGADSRAIPQPPSARLRGRRSTMFAGHAGIEFGEGTANSRSRRRRIRAFLTEGAA